LPIGRKIKPPQTVIAHFSDGPVVGAVAGLGAAGSRILYLIFENRITWIRKGPHAIRGSSSRAKSMNWMWSAATASSWTGAHTRCYPKPRRNSAR
jgi:hypothetical protein